MQSAARAPSATPSSGKLHSLWTWVEEKLHIVENNVLVKVVLSFPVFVIALLLELTQKIWLYLTFVILMIVALKVAWMIIVSSRQFATEMILTTLFSYMAVPLLYGLANAAVIVSIKAPDHWIYVEGKDLAYSVNIISVGSTYVVAMGVDKRLLLIPSGRITAIERIIPSDTRPLIDLSRLNLSHSANRRDE
ncbi:hypothetical protein [Mesorhizobium amorphae]|uniref:hypothetical protein n=1 Tax=Mesorhizobium amorphae TaxID=71433 RepID=UPI00178352B3|nr:hypothetical protein [Mesorhizobium amorphae]